MADKSLSDSWRTSFLPPLLIFCLKYKGQRENFWQQQVCDNLRGTYHISEMKTIRDIFYKEIESA